MKPRSIRRRLPQAVLLGVAATALVSTGPAGASSAPAGSVHLDAKGVLTFVGTSADEQFKVSENANRKVEVVVLSPTQVTAGPGCVKIPAAVLHKFECGTSPRNREVHVNVELEGGNDVIEWRLPISGHVSGGLGDDDFIPNPGYLGTTVASAAEIEAGGGHDTVNYSWAPEPVTVALAENSYSAGRDGRAGDRDKVDSDVERVVGSRFADFLFSGPHRTTIEPGAGRDTVVFNGDGDVFTTDGEPDSITCAATSVYFVDDPVDTATNCEQAPF